MLTRDNFKESFEIGDEIFAAFTIRWGRKRAVEPGRRCPPPSSILQASRGGEGRLKNLTGGVRGELEERWGRQEFLGQERERGQV